MEESKSVGEHRSESKDLVGQKRGIMEGEETDNISQKRVKMRDLDSVFRSEGRKVGNRELDLNVNIGGNNNGPSKSKGFDLDLNTEDFSSSINDPFYPYKNYENSKSRDDSECGSSVGPTGDKGSMMIWKGLKQNNYMSNPYGSVPLPKPRGRKKTNNDVMKRKIELAKKEQVDRFARVAAPSGLLNGLNPGIINHVRNSRQVHSIIEALVKSEKNENRHFGTQQFDQSKIDTHDVSEKKTSDYGMFYRSNYGVERGIFSKMGSKYDMVNENDGLALKLSSSENTSCLSNEESGNLNSVTSLSLKAANVASQWLELLNQDIRGRLAALRRSKKRVQSVITTDLPSLLSREFSSNLDKDSHSVKWNNLFGQMDKALSEEETHLENWLNQVKEMQLHCEKGLHNSNPNDTRSNNSEKDLAFRAAAASIYSTCNFILSTENLSCC